MINCTDPSQAVRLKRVRVWHRNIAKHRIESIAQTAIKLYLPTDLITSLDSTLGLSQKEQPFGISKLDFKNNCVAGGSGGGGTVTSGPASTTGGQNLCISSASPTDASQQFNIFPAIFSRQLNFSAAGTCSSQGKLMDDLRPNLVGGLLGLQQGLLEDHAIAHGNLQHSGHQESKFMSLQDNRLMGISSHENRLLGLSQDLRSAASINNLDNNKNASGTHQNRKCSSTPEDFSALYGGLSASGLGDTSSHHHTPAHTPPSRIDHTITGKFACIYKERNRQPITSVSIGKKISYAHVRLSRRQMLIVVTLYTCIYCSISLWAFALLFLSWHQSECTETINEGIIASGAVVVCCGFSYSCFIRSHTMCVGSTRCGLSSIEHYFGHLSVNKFDVMSSWAFVYIQRGDNCL